MYKGLKKKYSRTEYVKLTLTKDENKCYFCMHNWENYHINYTNEMDVAATEYFKSLCRRCLHKPKGEKKYWYEDNFKTLYDWEEK